MNIVWGKPVPDFAGQHDLGNIKREYNGQAGCENNNAVLDSVGYKRGGPGDPE